MRLFATGSATPLTWVYPSLNTDTLPFDGSNVTVTDAASRSPGVSTIWKAWRSLPDARSTTSEDGHGSAVGLAVGNTLVITSAYPSPRVAWRGTVAFGNVHHGGAQSEGGDGGGGAVVAPTTTRARSATACIGAGSLKWSGLSHAGHAVGSGSLCWWIRARPRR
eukprot:COSAG06_NODE_1095_length_10730_cov_3.273540_11_plen_164_part_00